MCVTETCSLFPLEASNPSDNYFHPFTEYIVAFALGDPLIEGILQGF